MPVLERFFPAAEPGRRRRTGEEPMPFPMGSLPGYQQGTLAWDLPEMIRMVKLVWKSKGELRGAKHRGVLESDDALGGSAGRSPSPPCKGAPGCRGAGPVPPWGRAPGGWRGLRGVLPAAAFPPARGWAPRGRGVPPPLPERGRPQPPCAQGFPGAAASASAPHAELRACGAPFRRGSLPRGRPGVSGGPRAVPLPSLQRLAGRCAPNAGPYGSVPEALLKSRSDLVPLHWVQTSCRVSLAPLTSS